MADGHLTFDTKIDSNGFNKGTKSMSSSLGSLKSSLLKIGSAVGIAFGVSKLIEFGKQAISTASDLQEVQNVVDTAFGEMSYKMEEFADKSIEQFGISKLSAKQTGSTFMAMASGMGIASDSASDMAIALTGLSADMSSFYNTEQSVSSTALKSIFTGETETLKQYGIVMTEANLQAYALSQGINKKISAMTQAEKVQLRYNYVMNATKLAQGDFAKTQDSWANQTRILSEQWREFSGIVGNVLMNVLAPGVKLLNNMLSSLISVANNAYNALAQLFGWTPSNASSVATTEDISTNIAESVDNQEELTNETEETGKAAKNSLASFDKINQRDEAKSSGSSGSSGGSTVSNSGVSASVKNETQKAVNDTVNSMQTLKKAWQNAYKEWGIEKFITNIQKGFNNINFKAIKDSFVSIFNSFKDIAKGTFDGIKNTVSSFADLIGAIIGGTLSGVGKSLETIVLGIQKFFEDNKAIITEYINSISNNLTSGFNSLKSAFVNLVNIWGESTDKMRETVANAISNILGGFTTFELSILNIYTSMFAISSANLDAWITSNKEKLSAFFESWQQIFADIANLIGDVLGDIGNTLTEWWDNTMAPVWDNFSNALLGVADTLLNVWNEWIYPIIQKIIEWFHNMWDNHLKGVFQAFLGFIASLGDAIATVWNNFLKPVVDWLIYTLKPIIMNVVDTILAVFSSLFGVICDVVKGIIDFFSGALDFVTGVFSGNWKKAWEGVKKAFKGVWDALVGIVKGVLNLIIDAINGLWSGLYAALAAVVNGVGGAIKAIGSVFGQKWGWEIPSTAPKIPKLATGTVVPANYGEFLAILGDNKREAEVVSPLSTIKQAVAEVLNQRGGGNDEVVEAINTLTQVLINKKFIDSPEKFARDYAPYFSGEKSRKGNYTVGAFA